MLIRQGPFASLIPIPNFMLGTQLTRQLGHYAGKAIKSLIKENFIIEKPTSYRMEVSLNVDKISEIKEMLGIKGN
jgi:hypothetical protein